MNKQNIPELDVNALKTFHCGVPGLSAREHVIPRETYHKRSIEYTSRLERLVSPAPDDYETDIITHRLQTNLIPKTRIEQETLNANRRERLERFQKEEELFERKEKIDDWRTSHLEDFKQEQATSQKSGRKENHALRNTPRWMELDREVLRFYVYMMEQVCSDFDYKLDHSGGEGRQCLRSFELLYYLASDEIKIYEPRVPNSGIAQGSFLKKTKASLFEVEVKKLIIGTQVSMLGRKFTIFDCDLKTRRHFFERFAIQQPGALTPPACDQNEPLFSARGGQQKAGKTLTQEQSEQKGRFNGNFYGDFKRYLEHGKRSLKFLAEWNDSRIPGVEDRRFFTILYYLCDDTIEIQEKFMPNCGRDSFKTFLKRSKPLKEDERSPRAPAASPSQNYLHWSDFICGRELSINKRAFFLITCDEDTLSYYEAKGTPQPQNDEARARLKSYQASQETRKPNVPKREETEAIKTQKQQSAYRKLQQFGAQSLKIRLRLVSEREDEADRDFVLAFFLADEQIVMFEPRKRNSGIIGGKFLERGKYLNELSGEVFKVGDLKDAIQNKKDICIMKRRYRITFVSQFTQEYLGISFNNPATNLKINMRRIADKFLFFLQREKIDFRKVFYGYDPKKRNYIKLVEFKAAVKDLQDLGETGVCLSFEEVEYLKMKFCSHSRFYYIDFCESVKKLINSFNATQGMSPLQATATNYGNTSQVEELLLRKLQHDSHSVRMMFRKFDTDKSGTLTFSEFQKLLRHFNLELTLNQVAEVMSKYDKDKQGTIDYNEFCKGVQLTEQSPNEEMSHHTRGDNLVDFDLGFCPGSESRNENDGSAGRGTVKASYLDTVQEQENQFQKQTHVDNLVARFCNLCASKKTEMRQTFRQLDDSKDGRISRDEFYHALRLFPEFSITDQDIILEFFFKHSTKHQLTYEEFTDIISQVNSQ